MKNYRDIFGWFTEGTADALRSLIKGYDISTVVEVGSFLGRSTAFFAENVSQVTAIDPFVAWPEGMNNGDARAAGDDFFRQFINNMKECGVAAKVIPVRLTSMEAYSEDLPRWFDLAYIDAAHDYESVRDDIALWRTRATKIICGDDYDENWPGVKQAVDEAFGDKVQLVGNFWYVML